MLGQGMGAAGAQASLLYYALMLLLLWSYCWKVVAFWKAARRDQWGWFLLLAILNTAGLLEIIYVFAVAPRRQDLVASAEPEVLPG